MSKFLINTMLSDALLSPCGGKGSISESLRESLKLGSVCQRHAFQKKNLIPFPPWRKTFLYIDGENANYLQGAVITMLSKVFGTVVVCNLMKLNLI